METTPMDRDASYRALLAGLIFVAIANAASAEPVPLTPEALVHSVTLQVTNRLAASAEEIALDPNYVEEIVADLVIPHVDFPSLTAATLRRHWYQLSAGEQLCATNGLRQSLLERYARVLLAYEYTSIVTDPLDDASGVRPIYVTQTAMTPHPQPLSVKYEMQLNGSAWKVVDFVVADVSLVNSYRVAFAEEIAEVGLGDFLRSIPECRNR